MSRAIRAALLQAVGRASPRGRRRRRSVTRSCMKRCFNSGHISRGDSVASMCRSPLMVRRSRSRPGTQSRNLKRAYWSRIRTSHAPSADRTHTAASRARWGALRSRSSFRRIASWEPMAASKALAPRRCGDDFSPSSADLLNRNNGTKHSSRRKSSRACTSTPAISCTSPKRPTAFALPRTTRISRVRSKPQRASDERVAAWVWEHAHPLD